jgi:hypothetical protein
MEFSIVIVVDEKNEMTRDVTHLVVFSLPN